MINNEVGDPGREIIYERLLTPFFRHIKAQVFLFVETNALIRANTFANKQKDQTFGYEKYKLHYMKHLQMKHFEKNKNDLFEFLELGEQFTDKLK